MENLKYHAFLLVVYNYSQTTLYQHLLNVQKVDNNICTSHFICRVLLVLLSFVGLGDVLLQGEKIDYSFIFNDNLSRVLHNYMI